MTGLGADLACLDATAQAGLVRRGQVTPVELVTAAIERAERLEGLNALPIRMFERALAAAERVPAVDPQEAPFAGVPFAFKNLGASCAGDPLTMGMRALVDADHRAPADDHLAARFRAAGLIAIGKTNASELGIKAVSEPAVYGPTHNPWRRGRSPGGSSGGSAAAVAAGIVPLAHASDGGGSIRIPASACGIVGLKPSRGRVSAGPADGEPWRGLGHEFAVTRSVRDAAHLLDAVHGPMPGDPGGVPAPARPYADELGADPGSLRIGLLDRAPAGWPAPHEDCAAAARDAAALLEDLGHRVQVAHPPILDELDYRTAFLTVLAAHVRETLDRIGAALGRPLREDDMELWTWALGEHGRGQATSDYLAAGRVFNAFARGLCAWWEDHDLLLTPTLPTPPPEHGSMDTPSDDPLRTFDILHDFLPFTPIANVSGQPAVSVPLATSADGLPIGVHLVAAHAREDVLIRVAFQLEGTRPWSWPDMISDQTSVQPSGRRRTLHL